VIRRSLIVLTLLILAGVFFRLSIVAAYHTSSPDGDQYFRLSQSLLRDHRYAFSPPPAPPTFARPPGYPLFLAYFVDRGILPRDAHIARAAYANVLIDLFTAIVLYFLLRDRRLPVVAALALAAVFACPLLFLTSTFALTESLATLLATVELWLILRAWDHRPSLLYAALAGVAAGLGQLVRSDALTLLPAVALALFWSADRWRPRLTLAATFAAAALLIFAPWPLRNLARFGAPHAEGTEWLAADGRPLPTGAIRWMRTWCTAAPGDSYLSALLFFGRRFNAHTPGLLLPRMYDSADERRRVEAILDGAGAGGLTPEIDAQLDELARERTWRAPFRTWVRLPLKRLARLYQSPPAAEMPIRVPFLGLPQHRELFDIWDYIMYGFAPFGIAFLIQENQRRFLAVLLLAVAARTLLHMFAVPSYVSQRYLAEAFPLLIALAAVGAAGLASRALAAARRGRALSPPTSRSDP
jgi:4-amino-4-deoxy-L-arabinose transferase-like glycosyltransferase